MWLIDKNVDKTTIEIAKGGTATFNYTVKVTPRRLSPTAAGRSRGTITITNPNDWEAITLTSVSDAVDNGGTCTVTEVAPYVVPKSGSLDVDYTCSFTRARQLQRQEHRHRHLGQGRLLHAHRLRLRRGPGHLRHRQGDQQGHHRRRRQDRSRQPDHPGHLELGRRRTHLHLQPRQARRRRHLHRLHQHRHHSGNPAVGLPEGHRLRRQGPHRQPRPPPAPMT